MDEAVSEIVLEILKYIELSHYFEDGRFDEYSRKKSVLVFMPGIVEITQLREAILALGRIEPPKEQIVEQFFHYHAFRHARPLCIHSSMTREEQDKMFELVHSNLRKIIIATNIAESSVTIPDVAFVIDSCFIKENEYDYSLGMNRLKLKFSSRASMRQRMGRTGRVEDGFCFRLMTQHFFNSSLSEYNDPEVLRCQLEKIVLKTKISSIGEPLSIIGDLVDRPTDVNLSLSFKTLINYGALSYPSLAHPSGEVTEIGKLMGMLPCDISLTKIIVTGFTLQVLQESVAIAAILSTDRDFFLHNYYQ